MLRLCCTVCLLALLVAAPVWAGEVTVVHDQAEAEQLLGRHLITNDRLCCRYIASPTFFGDSVVYEKDGLYHLHGGQDGYFRFKSPHFQGGYLRMDGFIKEIMRGGFVFHGTIKLGVLHYEVMRECNIDGDFLFSRLEDREKWTIQKNIMSSCEPSLTFPASIDILSKKEEG
jgi:hypothetical protein